MKPTINIKQHEHNYQQHWKFLQIQQKIEKNSIIPNVDIVLGVNGFDQLMATDDNIIHKRKQQQSTKKNKHQIQIGNCDQMIKKKKPLLVVERVLVPVRKKETRFY
jgi:uncharacterized protein YdaT